MISIVALVFFTWQFRKHDQLTNDGLTAEWETTLNTSKSRAHLVGFINYTCTAIHLLTTPLNISSDFLREPCHKVKAWTTALKHFKCEPSNMTTEELLSEHEIHSSVTCFTTSYWLAECIVKRVISLIHVIPLQARMRNTHAFWRKQPTLKVIHKLRISCRRRATDDVKDKSVPQVPGRCLDLPPNTGEFQKRKVFGGKFTEAFDAVRALKLIRFGNTLKSKGQTHMALSHAIDAAVHDDDAAADALKYFNQDTPSNKQCYRHYTRLDAVGMSIERREMANLYENHSDTLVSAHLFTDGSPVTGQELQGMVLQLAWDDDSVVDLWHPGNMSLDLRRHH
jgi:hypothetical protein